MSNVVNDNKAKTKRNTNEWNKIISKAGRKNNDKYIIGCWIYIFIMRCWCLTQILKSYEARIITSPSNQYF